jgi:hypothetical protein
MVYQPDPQDVATASGAVAAAVANAAGIDAGDLDATAAGADRVTNALAVLAAVMTGPVAANPPPAFALTPAVAIHGVVDYKTAEGRKIYSSATCKLDEELYDCKADGLNHFLKTAAARGEEFGWDNPGGCLQIPNDLNDPLGDSQNLIECYGTLDIAKIRAYEKMYLGNQVRAAQDAYMLFKCLMNSISRTSKDKITIWKDQYIVDGKSSGNLLLKIIIRESHLDTNATTSTIRTKLASLDIYIMTIGCDITKFNGYVMLLINMLAARGQRTMDLLVFLFKGYFAVPDTDFKDYIKRKKEDHDEGATTTSEQLMLMADAKYKLRLEYGDWNVANPQEEKILALQAKVAQLSKRKPNGNSTRDPKGKGKPPEKGSGASAKPAWMDKAPPSDDMKIPFKPREWKSKPWYYCCKQTGGKCAGVWRVHKPTDCKGKAHVYTPDASGQPKKKTKYNGDTPRKLKLAEAYVATLKAKVAEEVDDEETEDENDDMVEDQE